MSSCTHGTRVKRLPRLRLYAAPSANLFSGGAAHAFSPASHRRRYRPFRRLGWKYRTLGAAGIGFIGDRNRVERPRPSLGSPHARRLAPHGSSQRRGLGGADGFPSAARAHPNFKASADSCLYANSFVTSHVLNSSGPGGSFRDATSSYGRVAREVSV